MLRDGEMVSTPGYSAASKLIYSHPAEFKMPDVPDAPTREQVEQAIELLNYPVCDFPFEAQAHRSNALALMLTPPLRELVDGPVPLFPIDATTPGTGKGLLASVASLIATGRDAPVSPADERDKSERRKAITSLLLAGNQIWLLDNANNPIGNDSPLESFLTSTVWQDRQLSLNRMVNIQNRVTTMATGNNIRLIGDMPRRAVRIRLDPQMVDPHLRQEKSFHEKDLPGYVRRERGRLLAAIYTLARAWIRAGRPKPETDARLGSFEGWQHVIGGILLVAGVPEFLGTLREDAAEMESAVDEWPAFLAMLQRVFNSTFTCAQVRQKLQSRRFHNFVDVLPSDLPNSGDDKFTRRLGWALKSVEGRQYRLDDGRIVYVRRVGTKQHAVLWRVYEAGEESE